MLEFTKALLAKSTLFLGIYFLHLSKEDHTVQWLFLNINQPLNILLQFKVFGVRQYNMLVVLVPFIHIVLKTRQAFCKYALQFHFDMLHFLKTCSMARNMI